MNWDLTQAADWRTARESIRDGAPSDVARLLGARATATRRAIVQQIDLAQQGHIGGDMSVTDILTTLFSAVMNIEPSDPEWAERDRFILSKGHCAASLYATLAHSGYFPADELSTFMQPLSALNGHPNRNKVPGVETNTGPLGHGLPVGVGQALAARLQGRSGRVFVVMGDGEMQEGSNWEAFMAAAHHRLDNLTTIIDRNRLQQGARTEDTNALEPLDRKLAAFGCDVRIVDGHDYVELIRALRPGSDGQPVAVIANTIKGRGVSFAEDRVEWHHKVPSAEQVATALEELS
ncbi:transketolase [Ilumatobacter coccineus]|uniref:Transketolase n=1 Tax=Ilumatobacter coccineus (strain NBRC 103263 / KCTC 29153 / YM16-304) TaxID=1313172 RepID=A0A6C7EAJ6_ILUCY|nr:transketolase [Ilumatobacter coccineus]BAN03491.1 transketolase [Ilumatobacter coccineus YM16-304]